MTTYIESSTSWEEQPAQQEEGLEASAERVSELFSSTITSLAADVHALKHLTTWKDILEENEENPVELTDRREEFMESLCDLNDVVSAVEKKVVTLRQIVNEEKNALENLNLLHQDSVEQNENLQLLVERCRSIQVAPKKQVQEKTATKSRATTKATTGRSSYPSARNSHSKPTTTSKSTARTPLATTLPSSNSSETHHTHVEGLSCHFDPVTVEELERVPRTTRGRVGVDVINVALANIGKCFHKKAMKTKKQQLLLQESRHVALARYQGVADQPMNDEELIQNLVVTEQELRTSCDFFAVGEGKARTVLAILKELKRIKQVPQKKRGLYMYRLCLD